MLLMCIFLRKYCNYGLAPMYPMLAFITAACSEFICNSV